MIKSSGRTVKFNACQLKPTNLTEFVGFTLSWSLFLLTSNTNELHYKPDSIGNNRIQGGEIPNSLLEKAV